MTTDPYVLLGIGMVCLGLALVRVMPVLLPVLASILLILATVAAGKSAKEIFLAGAVGLLIMLVARPDSNETPFAFSLIWLGATVPLAPEFLYRFLETNPENGSLGWLIMLGCIVIYSVIGIGHGLGLKGIGLVMAGATGVMLIHLPILSVFLISALGLLLLMTLLTGRSEEHDSRKG